jgi:hypothetical protein
MFFLPLDPNSFTLGAVVGIVGAFGTGFLKKAGEDFYSWVKNKIHPKLPESIQIDGTFLPSQFEPGSCAWIRQERLYEFEEQAYSYYPHRKNGARCFRVTYDGSKPLTEYLMVKPGATRKVSS